MIQRHSIVLWRKAENQNRDFDDFAKDAYDTLKTLKDFPDEFRPNYLSGKSKTNIENFDWNYSNFCETLKKGVNKENGNIFEELGYSISFFSSLDEERSCSFQMKVGNKSDKFYNTLIINLPVSFDLQSKENACLIKKIFERLVFVYNPYWGCVSNRVISRKYGKFLDGNIPTTIHWINYLSEDTIERIGLNKIKMIFSENPEAYINNGILIIKDTAFDASIEDDLLLHDTMHNLILGD